MNRQTMTVRPVFEELIVAAMDAGAVSGCRLRLRLQTSEARL
ncbi:MAG: hypothetical protein AAGI27_15895 [Pseudomonadota bacterium]